MRYIISLLTVLTLALPTQLVAKELKANISFYNYYGEGNLGYTEFYFSFDGNSINSSKISENKFQGAVNISISASIGDSVFFFDKLKVNSPFVNSINDSLPPFLYKIQIPLTIGKSYDIDIVMDDANEDDIPKTISQKLELPFKADKIGLSDLMLLESFEKTTGNSTFTKGSLEIIPLIQPGYYYFPPEFDQLSFYVEIYNVGAVLGENKRVMVRYFIETFETRKKIRQFGGQKLLQNENIHVLLAPMKITSLASGNYNLKVELINEEQELISSQSIFFQRNNPIKMDSENFTGDFAIENSFVSDIDSMRLVKYIDCLFPISTQPEVNTAEYLTGFGKEDPAQGNLKMMRSFFHTFWLNRNFNEPEAAWLAYRKQVDIAEKEFATPIQSGFQTDRGRVYLKYGKPDKIELSEHEPNAIPYQIWQYYGTLGQSNVIFVFGGRQMSTNDYSIIHSTARGETNNPRWRIDLHERFKSKPNWDNNRQMNQFGSGTDNNTIINER